MFSLNAGDSFRAKSQTEITQNELAVFKTSKMKFVSLQ